MPGNRTVAALMGFIVLVLVLGTGVSTYFAVRANRNANEARANLRLARHETQRRDKCSTY